MTTIGRESQLWRARVRPSGLRERAIDAGDQRLVAEGLAEVLDGPGAARAVPREGVVVGGDEDDRDPPSGGHEPLVELEPAEPAEMHVQHETADRHVPRCQELLGRRERRDGEAAGAEQALERTPEGDVVVDHTDHRRSSFLIVRSDPQLALVSRVRRSGPTLGRAARVRHEVLVQYELVHYAWRVRLVAHGLHGVLAGQLDVEREAAIDIDRRPDPAAVRLDDRATDRQPHAEAAGLAGDEPLEHPLEIRPLRADAGLADGDLHEIRS